jgi:putative tryptophan/tyrosine transport system substrate-binding protein
MRRRHFIAVLGAGAAWPFAARAQQPAMPVLGFLDTATDSGEKLVRFYEGLKNEGYVQNQSVTVDYRSAGNDDSRLPALAADLVNRKVAAIAAAGLPAALAAKAATTTIPIVFAIAPDPVRTGLVDSLNRPGGNLTGVTGMGLQFEQKRLELLHELLPAASDFALLVNPANPNAEAQTAAAQAAAGKTGVKVHVLSARAESEFDPAFAALADLHAAGIAISDDGLFASASAQLAAMALRRAMPAIFQNRAFAAAGGLMSYGGSPAEFYHQLGAYSALVLKGAKAADLPVFQSTQIEFIINRKTAKSLGIAVPPSLLGRAEQLIE